MRKCEIIATAIPIDPRTFNSPLHAMAHCRTHNMPLPHLPIGDLCPVGQVEQAVEEGLAIIRAARDELPPKK